MLRAGFGWWNLEVSLGLEGVVLPTSISAWTTPTPPPLTPAGGLWGPAAQDVLGACTRQLDGTGRARPAPPARPRGGGRICRGVFVWARHYYFSNSGHRILTQNGSHVIDGVGAGALQELGYPPPCALAAQTRLVASSSCIKTPQN